MTRQHSLPSSLMSISVPWGGQHFGRQADAFTDALQWLRGRADWCAFIDADEFLFDPTSTLADELYRLPLAVSAVAVNQRVFGTSWHEHASDEPVTKRFTLRAKDDYHGHYWIKTIARPQATSGFNTQHGVVLSHGSYVMSDQTPLETRDHPGHATHIAKTGIRLHHYILKSREEYREKQMRGAVSDRADYKRHTDDFFRILEKDTNSVLDETLLPAALGLEESHQFCQMIGDCYRIAFDRRGC